MADAILTEVIGGVQAIGFPGVAFYLIYRMADGTIRANTVVLTQIQVTLEKVCERLNAHTP